MRYPSLRTPFKTEIRLKAAHLDRADSPHRQKIFRLAKGTVPMTMLNNRLGQMRADSGKRLQLPSGSRIDINPPLRNPLLFHRGACRLNREFRTPLRPKLKRID